MSDTKLQLSKDWKKWTITKKYWLYKQNYSNSIFTLFTVCGSDTVSVHSAVSDRSAHVFDTGGGGKVTWGRWEEDIMSQKYYTVNSQNT